MTKEIIASLEKKGRKLGDKDRSIYNEILNVTANWQLPQKRTENEIWTTLENEITKPQVGSLLSRPWLRWAASIAAVVGIAVSFAILKPEAQSYSASSMQEITLPDGSHVSLNARSTLSYDETWSGDRIATLDGKAFFNVTKGKTFTIFTSNGEVIVLGTSFNVNTFDNKLIVECISGKVRVEVENSSLLLTPGLTVKASEGNLGEVAQFDVAKSKSWISGEFYFENTPLGEVFTEVERQFGIQVDLDVATKKRTYTGLFHKEDHIDEVLESICLPMNLRYDNTQDNLFVVKDK